MSAPETIDYADRLIEHLQCDRPDCACHRHGSPERLLHCPAHADRTPSLAVRRRLHGLPLVYCHAGCAQADVLAALRDRGVWPTRETHAARLPLSTRPSDGLTLEALAAAKKLNLGWLRRLGLADCRHQGKRAIQIPYADTDHNIVAVRFRVAQEGARFKWRKGDHVILYGLDRLAAIRRVGWVLLVEGESDCWTLWQKGVPALGIPGKSTWRAEWAKYLAGLDVYLWQEPDAADLVARIGQSLPGFRVIQAPEGIKDPSAAHILGHDVARLIDELKTKSMQAESILRGIQNAELARLEQRAASVLQCADPLRLVEQEIRRQGYGGDVRPAVIVYLAATARVLCVPTGSMLAHLLLLGTPSAGKSWTVRCALSLLPDEATHTIDAGSPRALIYDEADLRHRVVVFGEADSLPAGEDNPAASAIRNLLQDGRLHYAAVVRNPETGDFCVREVDKPGPTVLITTSVRRLGEQLMTRFFTLEMVDTQEQICAALRTQAERELHAPQPPDPALVAFQGYLQAQAGWNVRIPFAQELAAAIESSRATPRLLRDFPRLLSLIKAVAVIRHRQRQRNPEGQLLAQIDDYATVRELVGSLYAEAVSEASDAVRATVAQVQDLKGQGAQKITTRGVADALRISRFAATRRIHAALASGWLVNNETRPGHPADLELGEPLPERPGLPEPQELARRCDAASLSHDS